MIAPISAAVMICRAHGGVDVPPGKSLLQTERGRMLLQTGYRGGGNTKFQPASFTSSHVEPGCTKELEEMGM